MTYGGFKRMTGFCKVHVPQEINDIVEANKDNDEAIKVGVVQGLGSASKGTNNARVHLIISYQLV